MRHVSNFQLSYLTLSHPEALPRQVKSSGVRQSKITKGPCFGRSRRERVKEWFMVGLAMETLAHSAHIPTAISCSPKLSHLFDYSSVKTQFFYFLPVNMKCYFQTCNHTSSFISDRNRPSHQVPCCTSFLLDQTSDLILAVCAMQTFTTCLHLI